MAKKVKINFKDLSTDELLEKESEEKNTVAKTKV